jgi:chromosome segregation ATPase
MAMKFFRIGAANAKITELEASIAALTKERDEVISAIPENNKEIVAQAEDLKNNLAASIADLTTAKQTIGSLETQIKSLESMNAELTKSIEAKDKEVDAKVATKVAAIESTLGAPSAPIAPASAKSSKELTGMDRVRAAARADLEKAGYVSKN